MRHGFSVVIPVIMQGLKRGTQNKRYAKTPAKQKITGQKRKITSVGKWKKNWCIAGVWGPGRAWEFIIERSLWTSCTNRKKNILNPSKQWRQFADGLCFSWTGSSSCPWDHFLCHSYWTKEVSPVPSVELKGDTILSPQMNKKKLQNIHAFPPQCCQLVSIQWQLVTLFQPVTCKLSTQSSPPHPGRPGCLTSNHQSRSQKLSEVVTLHRSY